MRDMKGLSTSKRWPEQVSGVVTSKSGNILGLGYDKHACASNLCEQAALLPLGHQM